MSLFTSSHFASACASGTDWRDTAKAVLEKLESIKTDNADFNLGFLYVSDHLADDIESILTLFKSVLGVENWIGAVAVGVCGYGETYIDVPAISAMVGIFEPDSFCLFPANDGSGEFADSNLKPWLETHDPMLVFTHGDPLSEEDPAMGLEQVNTVTQGFMIGGLSSSRKQQIQIAGDLQSNGISGAAFSQDVKVATTLSQGCEPIGEAHVITRGHEHVILELDGEKAVEVFEQDLRALAIRKVNRDPDDIVVDQYDIENMDDMPKEFHSLLKGEIHAAFPVSESDQKDYLVRNIMGLDPDEGSITVSQFITSGESVLFVHRDEETVREDLSRSLVELRKRVQSETGTFEPKGAVFVSCVARAPEQRGESGFSEMDLIQDIIGDVPLTGFYAGGEISNARLYGYTGILTLFL